MKKILTPLLGTLLLLFAHPSFATFYSQDDSRTSASDLAEHEFNGLGAKSGEWLSKESNRNNQLEALKQKIRDKQKQGSRLRDDKKYALQQWSKPDFKQYDHKFWSRDDLNKAMQCWLAPHLHEDKEFVNRHWKNHVDKWKQHKHYKHKWQKPWPDKPSEVPLPAAAWLLGSALLGLTAIGRQRTEPV
ncbi:MAG: VPLPA-CTERM sorting domain-containing protein [Pseudomonadales bacterium]